MKGSVGLPADNIVTKEEVKISGDSLADVNDSFQIIEGNIMFAIILMLGSFVWVVSELAEIAQGSYTTLNSSLSALAFALIASGIFALWPAIGKDMTGRAGVGLISFGMWVFALVALMVIGSDVRSDADISQSTIFLIAGTAVTIGALALGVWIITKSKLPNWLGIAQILITLFSIGVAFVPLLTPFQPFANLGLAAILFWIGFSTRAADNKMPAK